MEFLPRIIRLRDAATYLGMDKNRFDEEVRPNLMEMPIGSQGVGFDRLDLDAWVDEYKAANGRPGKQKGGKDPWRKEKVFRDSSKGVRSGISTKWSEEEEFANLVKLRTSKKHNNV
jgi:predicted DNA-binding transcriptional regulator AlpA